MRTFNLQSGTPACDYNAQSQRAITPHNHTVVFRRERTTTMTPAVLSSAAMTTMKAMPAPPVSGSCAMLCTFSTVSELLPLLSTAVGVTRPYGSDAAPITGIVLHHSLRLGLAMDRR